jgi:hypothetical protein
MDDLELEKYCFGKHNTAEDKYWLHEELEKRGFTMLYSASERPSSEYKDYKYAFGFQRNGDTIHWRILNGIGKIDKSLEWWKTNVLGIITITDNSHTVTDSKLDKQIINFLENGKQT